MLENGERLQAGVARLVGGYCTLLSLRGWLCSLDIPFVNVSLGSIWSTTKVYFFLFGYVSVHFAFPRYRYDQSIRLG